MEEVRKLQVEYHNVVNYLIDHFPNIFKSHKIVKVSTRTLIFVEGEIYLKNECNENESFNSKPESISVLIITHVFQEKSSIQVNDEFFQFENEEESFHKTALKIINKLASLKAN